MGIVRLAQSIRSLAVMACLWPAIVAGQGRTIDTGNSVVTIHVSKRGLLSGFAHNHEITAPIVGGTVEVSPQRVFLSVDARKMRVLDPEASESARADIQKTMLGPTVLDSEHFPNIAFRSLSVVQTVNDHWSVNGDLTLHGQTKPITLDGALKDGHYRGEKSLKQSNFDISPVSIAGGTVTVKDELKIDFDVVLAN